MTTEYRHEWKHEINYSDMIAIRQRLKAVARPDSHAVNGSITVGIVLAAGMIPLAVIGSVIIGVILLVFVNKSNAG